MIVLGDLKTMQHVSPSIIVDRYFVTLSPHDEYIITRRFVLRLVVALSFQTFQKHSPDLLPFFGHLCASCECLHLFALL